MNMRSWVFQHLPLKDAMRKKEIPQQNETLRNCVSLEEY